MDSHQNKILVLTNCMNVLSSSFTSMQYFLNILLVRKKINQRKILFLLSKNNQFNKKRKRKRNSPTSGVRPGQTSSWLYKFKKNIKLLKEWKESFRMSEESLYKLCHELRIYLEKQSQLLVHYIIQQMKEDYVKQLMRLESFGIVWNASATNFFIK